MSIKRITTPLHTYILSHSREISMKNTTKYLLTLGLMLLMAFSVFSAQGSLVNPSSLSIRGNVNLYIEDWVCTGFVNHFNSLNLGFSINSVILNPGDGFLPYPTSAFEGVYHENQPYTDLGQLSRYPHLSELTNPSHSNAMLWSIGWDSIAIVISSSNTWLSTELSMAQVADIFCGPYEYWDSLPTQYLVGNAPHQPICRAIPNLMGGVNNCFEKFFLQPVGKNIYDIAPSCRVFMDDQQLGVEASDCVYWHLSTTFGKEYWIGLMSMGRMIYGNDCYEPDPVTPISIWNPSRGCYYAPTKENWLRGYLPPLPLTMLTVGVPSILTDDKAKSVLISYLRLPDPMNPEFMGDYCDIQQPNFISYNGYMTTARCDFAGGPVFDAAYNVYTPLPGQTQTFPDNVVSAEDLFYFASAYGDVTHVNPYIDMNADGIIDADDVFIFVANF